MVKRTRGRSELRAVGSSARRKRGCGKEVQVRVERRGKRGELWEQGGQPKRQKRNMTRQEAVVVGQRIEQEQEQKEQLGDNTGEQMREWAYQVQRGGARRDPG